jgi:hypothetical protein
MLSPFCDRIILAQLFDFPAGGFVPAPARTFSIFGKAVRF